MWDKLQELNSLEIISNLSDEKLQELKIQLVSIREKVRNEIPDFVIEISQPQKSFTSAFDWIEHIDVMNYRDAKTWEKVPK